VTDASDDRVDDDHGGDDRNDTDRGDDGDRGNDGAREGVDADTHDDRTARSAQRDADVPNRRRAALATLPFLALGLGVIVLAVLVAPQPLWAFLLLPPVLFMSVLTYLTFRSGFLTDR